MVALAGLLFAQQAAAPKPQFFAGVVSHIDAKRVNVSRTLPGRSPENRAFAIDGATKMPKGGIKPRTRVTVRYQHVAEGDLALEIQIRTAERVTKAP
jgi:hypothetical protein